MSELIPQICDLIIGSFPCEPLVSITPGAVICPYLGPLEKRIAIPQIKMGFPFGGQYQVPRSSYAMIKREGRDYIPEILFPARDLSFVTSLQGDAHSQGGIGCIVLIGILILPSKAKKL